MSSKGKTSGGLWTPTSGKGKTSLSHCDKEMLHALTSCDYRGGLPKWGKSKGKIPPYGSCAVSPKHLAEFQKLWNANLEGCRYFQNQNNQLVTSPLNFDMKQFNARFSKIMELKAEIETKLKGAPPGLTKIFKNALRYVNDLASNHESIRYEFKNPKISIDYKWFQIKEMDQLIVQLTEFRNSLK